jgi:hypothetical protein
MTAQSTFETLVRDGATLAIDTESDGASTLSVQVAARDPTGQLVAQVYHAPDIAFPAGFRAVNHLQGLGLDAGIGCRPPKAISADLSPTQVLADVFCLQGATPLSRAAGVLKLRDRNSQPANGIWDETARQWRVPQLKACLVGHFLQADIPRCFGRRFYDALFRPTPGIPNVDLSGRKRLTFVAQGRNFADYAPIVEFFQTQDGHLYAIRLTTLDTMLPFGPGSLDRLCQTFLGVGKSAAFSPDEMEQMRYAFQRRPEAAFGYALRDVILTLLLYEKMLERDRAMYEAFGLTPLRPMKATLGSRVAEFVFAATLQFASSSTVLNNPQRLKRLMRTGAVQRFQGNPEGSRFGEQTGAVHGGLRFTRSPTQFFHEAPNLLRDIDLQSCYPTIAARINAYWGTPVLLEPGNRGTSLRDGVALARRCR